MTGGNDGRFPDDSAVLVRYPDAPQAQQVTGPEARAEREAWPWLSGTVEEQCGPDEWLVTVEDRRVAELADGSPALDGTPDEDLFFPQCFRDSSEIRPNLQADREAGA